MQHVLTHYVSKQNSKGKKKNKRVRTDDHTSRFEYSWLEAELLQGASSAIIAHLEQC